MNDSARLSSVETRVEGIETTLGTMQRDMRALTEAVQNIGKPNWQAWGVLVSITVGAIGFIFIVIGSSAQGPLTDIEEIKVRQGRRDDEMAMVGHKLEGFAQKLNEVETQFRSKDALDATRWMWASDVENQRSAYAERLHEIMWEKVFGTRLPPLVYEPYKTLPQMPSGPYHSNGKTTP